MCLIFLSIQQHPDYPLIIAANRDEFFSRPTAALHPWPSNPNIIAGQDLQADGTWLGITKTGRFAALTNYRKPEIASHAKSRGELCHDFLNSNISIEFFLDKLKSTAQEYAGFNIIFGQLTAESIQLHYFENQTNNHYPLERGINGLSNSTLNSSWPKIEEGKKAITPLLKNSFNHEDWLAVLSDKTIAADQYLPDTGIGLEKERQLSSRFIQLEEKGNQARYGTRCSTLLSLSNTGIINITERSYNSVAQAEASQNFQFKLLT